MNPISHSTHIVLGLIWGSVIIVLNWIEFSYVVAGNLSYTIAGVFSVQNVAIALANSYYLSKIEIQTSPQGITLNSQDSVQKPEVKQ